MSVTQRILSAECWLLAMAVYHDGWTWYRYERARQILMAYRNVYEEEGKPA